MKKIILSLLITISFSSIAQDWTWLRGSSTGSIVATYGTMGVSAPGNDPGGRHGAACWTDAAGNLWQFGGEGYASTPAFGWLNDLWKYTPATNEWTWIRGSNVVDQIGLYGTLGVSSPTNEPGAREFQMWWQDNLGNFWMFGGDGFDAFGTWGRLNDLWKYNPTTNEWTWMSGSNLANQNGTYGTIAVPAPANIPGGRHGGGTWCDNSNNLWLIGGYGYPATGGDGYLNDVWRFNTTTNQWTWIKGTNIINQTGTYGPKGLAVPSNEPGGREFPSIWKDPAGAVWMFGGGGYSSVGFGHLNDLWRYNQTSNMWIYESGTNLGNQLANNGTLGVPSSTNIPGGRYSAFPVFDNWGNLWLFGGIGYPGTFGIGRLNDLWKYTPSTDEWTWMKGANAINQNGIYGTQGVSAPANNPGARYYNIGWKDLNGDMVIFGSFGYPAVTGLNNLNDLWKYKITCAPFNITDAFSVNICNGDSTLLSVATVSSSTVTWYSSPTSTVSLGTGNSYNISSLATGNYTFYAEGSPCNERTPITVSVSPCTSVKSNVVETKTIRLYPNPNNGVFYLSPNVKEGKFVLYNSIGQEVIKKELNGEIYLDVEISKGIYYYFVEEKGVKVGNGKMVVE
ncbi:MAG: T9SS type A sorting domain-containing protein [Sphingobacteriaceae bacterium]|nr:T9SS type A sorting domain-containing protein [Sphingobacteriaceae bacterium]